MKVNVKVTDENGITHVFNTIKEAQEYIERCAAREKLKKAGIQDIEKCLETNRKNALLALMIISNSYRYTTEDIIELSDAIMYCLNHLYSTTALTINQLVKELMEKELDGDIKLDIAGLDLNTWVIALKELSDRDAISFYVLDGIYFIGLPPVTQRLANSTPDLEETGESIEAYESHYHPYEE